MKRVTIRFEDKVVNIIDDWRREQSPIPSFNQAVNVLITNEFAIQHIDSKMLDELNDVFKRASEKAERRNDCFG